MDTSLRMRGAAPTIAVAGFLQNPSGAGIIHERLAHELDRAGMSGRRGLSMPLYEEVPSLVERLRSRAPGADALIWTSSPLPLRLGQSHRLFPFVYDLRWLHTRGTAAKIYRAVDLSRSIRAATAVFTISESVASQLALFTRKPVSVVPLGPGQFEGYVSPSPNNTRTIVLIGNSPHKRNEEAAQLLTSSIAVRRSYRIVGVRVSSKCTDILARQMPPDRWTTFETVSRDELARILTDASVYLSLGRDEGFGFPYVEASYFACDVIAPDCPVSREVMGRSPVLLQENPTTRDIEKSLEMWDTDRVLNARRQATERAWADTAHAVSDVIHRYM